MNRPLSLLGSAACGAGVGAGLMYLFDPSRGARRRALLRDQLIHTTNLTQEGLDTASRDLAHRVQGFWAELRTLPMRQQRDHVMDQVLVERVRAKMGRVVSHPSAIEVTATDDGRVTLSGPILAREVNRLLSIVSAVRGVHGVENRLHVYERAEDIPGLQGGAPRQGDRFEYLQTNWSPGARLGAVSAGGALLSFGVLRRGLFGLLAAALGLGLVVRGLTNLPLKRLIGVGAGRQAVTIQKAININAPVEGVFAVWSHYELFPRLMEHVREVQRGSDNQSHWVVAGPLGTNIAWDAEITEVAPNQELAWKTLPGAPVQHAGIVRFTRNHAGGTHLDIRLSYNPPGGALGHIVARLLGSDPKRMLDDDLVRFKSLLEQGKTRVHHHQIALNELVTGIPS